MCGRQCGGVGGSHIQQAQRALGYGGEYRGGNRAAAIGGPLGIIDHDHCHNARIVDGCDAGKPGDILVGKDYATYNDIEAALARADKGGKRVGQILVEAGVGRVNNSSRTLAVELERAYTPRS